MSRPEAHAMRHAIARGALGLGLFALVTAGVVAGTRALTAERIAENRQASQFRALIEVLPPSLGGVAVQDLQDGATTLPASPALGQDTSFTAWRVRHDDAATVVLPVIAPQGYSGAIELLVGITADGRLGGVRVIRHQETPGLGDAIERRKSDWVLDFTGRSLDDPDADGWAVAPDGGAFDAFTGATITPRAVVEAVHASLLYAEEHHRRLFGSAAEDTTQGAAP